MKNPLHTLIFSPWAPLSIGGVWMVVSAIALFTPLLPTPTFYVLYAITCLVFGAVMIVLFISQAFTTVQGVVLLGGLVAHLTGLLAPGISDHLAMMGTVVTFALLVVIPPSVVTRIRAGIWGTMDAQALATWLQTHRNPVVLHTLEARESQRIPVRIKPTGPWGTVSIDLHNERIGAYALEQAIIEGLNNRVLTGINTMVLGATTPSAHERLKMHGLSNAPSLPQEMQRVMTIPTLVGSIFIATIVTFGLWSFDAALRKDVAHDRWMLASYRAALAEDPITIGREDSMWLQNTALGARVYPVRAFKGQHFLVCVDTPSGVHSYTTYHPSQSNTMHLHNAPVHSTVYADNICTDESSQG